ncbi:terminal uridylyltransferase 7 isoform X2 [Boleophthalmus pectinirostris]|uniref:terminal uridylyltransferase 7 isoform X2 n=1 Tax=Boleophthalmus pectinirostris TaxID=150288 RepID=UPI0024310463|nr:terminal uridylyltransferase 7 isoform X2 [Boleophthalmus pectinirostris]
MDNPGRPHQNWQGGWDRTYDQARGQNFRPEGGHQGRNNQSEFRGTSKRGRQNFQGSSPGGFRGGHSPSLRDDLRWASSPDTSGGSQANHKKERFEPQNWRTRPLSESPREDTEATDGNTHKSGKRRNRNRNTPSENNGEAVNERPSTKADRSIRQAERRLQRDGINPLRKPPNSHPNAVYTCSLCDIYLDSVADAYKHIFKDRRHKKRSKERQEQELLTVISPPSVEQVSAINAALEDVVREHGMTDKDVEARQQAVSIMQDLLLCVMPGITLRLYGSSCTKFGFKKSDVNIDIQFPPEMTQPNVLSLVKECLSVSPLYDDLEADFHARVPVVVCKEKNSGLICKVSAGNENAFQTTSYLSALVHQEPLLLPLVLGLRRWAQICQIDRPEEGGLPSYAFALMVVYFLQQRKQALLPTYLNQEIKVFSLSRLKDFSLTHVDDDGHIHWVYSPSSSKESLDRSSPNGKVPLGLQHPHPPVEVGLLWVEMLRFYSLEFKIEDYVISVRTRAVLSREMKDWPKKRIAVEDPFAVKRNVARSVNSQQVHDYIIHCLKTTYKYFALAPNTPTLGHKLKRNRGKDEFDLPDANKIIIEPQSLNQSKNEETAPDDSDCIIEEELEDSESEKDTEKADLRKGSLSEEEEEEGGELEEVDTQLRRHMDSLTTEDEELFPLDEISGEELLSEDEGPDLYTSGFMDKVDKVEEPQEDSITLDKPEGEKHGSLSYRFTKQAFTRGKSHIVVCALCKRDGHLKKDCPEDFKKVELDPLPPMTPDFLRVLDKVCEQCYTDFAPGELEERVRDHILQDLQTFVRRHFPDTKLQLFGSSKNGFGFRQSDLDICMMLEGRDTIEDDACISIIESLAKLLKKHSGLKNILPITTAKVPIVKFYHVQTGLEGDISLYNTLALHNTHLLASYAAIDTRVKILCYVMKVFAKMCDIGDASRGSLSSYAYTLMVLFYLQQRNPPVIPVLQEMYDGKKPEKLVDGWNVYFFDDLDALPSRWPHYGKNRESVGELWLGLLQFYTEDFDFREHVVCIRQHARLTTFNKQWTSKLIAIEDPFDLNHNLGAGLSRKMINFIMKAFINSRKVFGTPVSTIPVQYPSTMKVRWLLMIDVAESVGRLDTS